MRRVAMLSMAICLTCAPAVSAASKANTKVTIDAAFLAAGETQWAGDIFSPRKSCKNLRRVIVFRVRPGADQKIGATRAKRGISSPGYFWTLSKPGAAPDGKYYARVRPTPACLGDRSANLAMGSFAGRAGPAPRIVGGSPDRYNDTRWITYIGWYDGGRCTGSLITPRHVLTAAHCMVGEPANNTWVRIGSKYMNRGGVRRNVSRIYMYPRYVDNQRFTNWGDMAILRLDRPTRISKPVSLIKKGFYRSGEDVYVAGWGNTRNSGGSPRRLRGAWLKSLKDDPCEKAFGHFYSGRVMMCAGLAPFREKDTCQGDSGGPIAWWTGRRWKLFGVTSWGNGCAKGDPGVYAWVGSGFLRTWIRRVTGR